MKLKNKISVSVGTIILMVSALTICYAIIHRYSDKADSVKTGNIKIHNVNKSASQNDFKTFVLKKKRFPVKEAEVSIIFAGDVMLSRDVAERMNARKDPNYPFREIAGYLKTGDAVFANLESPITPGLPVKKEEFKLRAEPGVEKALKNAGFTVLSLANNHSFDFGEKGVADTTGFLKQAGIDFAGAGFNERTANQAAYLNRQGIRFALLAYTDKSLSSPKSIASQNSAGTAAMNVDSMTKAVKNAERKADFVVVSMHAGTEYSEVPNQKQVEFAHSAIDAGADIVIGHHPHVVQKAECYKGKYIFYSLGNFVFDQMWSEATREGIAVKAYFTKKEIKKFEFQPVLIKDFAQPVPIDSIGTIANGDREDADRINRIIGRLKIPLSDQAVLRWNREQNDFALNSINNRLIDSSDAHDPNSRKNPCNTGAISGIATADKIEPSEYRINKSLTADLDGDKRRERCSLKNGRLTVTQGPELIWKSKDTWWVDNFALADSTGDGKIDLNMSVWKSGSFGSSRPFWISENDRSIKNHFFVFDFDGTSVKPVWQSSSLDRPNREFVFNDLDCDGVQELIVIEGEYDGSKTNKPENNISNKDITFERRYLAVWKWNGWGFSCEWRSPPATYSDIRILEINGIEHIFADNFSRKLL